MRYALLLAAGLAAVAAAADDPPKPADPSAAEDVQDVVFLGPGRPVLVRLHVETEGRPFQARWHAAYRELFAYLDRDNNGTLDGEEFGRAPAPTQLAQGSLFRAPAGPALRLADADTDEDGKVTPQEFLNHYRRTGPGPMILSVAPGLGTVLDPLTDAIFGRLDRDKDGKLSKDEVAEATAWPGKLDADDDETVSARELAPEYVPANVTTVPVPPGGGLGSPVMLAVPDDSPKRLTERLRFAREVLDRYDANRDQRLSRTEVALDKDRFDRLDGNRDGEINAVELLRWMILTPDLAFAVRFGAGADKAALEALSPGGRPAPLAAALRPGGGGLLLGLAAAQLDFRLASDGRTAEQRQQANQAARRNVLTQFKTADKDQSGRLDRAEVEPRQFAVFKGHFELIDRDGDGRMTEKEFNDFLDLQDQLAAASARLSVVDQGCRLFDLLDASRDGRLSVRELRTAWSRVAEYDKAGQGQVARDAVPRQYQFTLTHGAFQAQATPGQVVAIPGAAPAPAARPVAEVGPVWFRKMDRNGDGDVSPREFLGGRAAFQKIDADGDGYISPEEADRADAAARGQPRP